MPKTRNEILEMNIARNKDDLWYSQDEVTELHRELSERLFECNPESKFLKMQERIIAEVFKKFTSQSKEVFCVIHHLREPCFRCKRKI